MNQWLNRVGTARALGADCAVVFHRVRCAQCDGRCGLSLGGGEVRLDADLPEGAAVEVVASVRGLARRAMGVFGWPLAAIVVMATVAEWSKLGETVVVGVVLTVVFAVVGLRVAFAEGDQAASEETSRRQVEGGRQPSPTFKKTRCPSGADDVVRVILG